MLGDGSGNDRFATRNYRYAFGHLRLTDRTMTGTKFWRMATGLRHDGYDRATMYVGLDDDGLCPGADGYDLAMKDVRWTSSNFVRATTSFVWAYTGCGPGND